eukprot:comp4708_c0_seq1/m.871 comp4708_c0_seq1/g.871  ORF comp4708_c0_seq1/g.871 comp4708_c0_seq1/m.871 type:complete len:272 (-) comp4708_c0_seq1:503-1318(-)
MGEDAKNVFQSIHDLFSAQGYLCVGLETPEDGPGSKTLPVGWDSYSDVWTLCYRHPSTKDTVYTLKAVLMGSKLLVHVLSGETVHSCEIDVGQCVVGGKVAPSRVRAMVGPMLDKMDVRKEPKPADSDEKQKKPQPAHADPLRVPPRRPIDPLADPLAMGPGRAGMVGGPYGGYGDTDRLPHFGGGFPVPGQMPGGGGMFMGPPGGMGIGGRGGFGGEDDIYGMPRGAVPPGARFDPFGPPDPRNPRNARGGRGDPDPDHLPPPGYGNMFM